jgi:hypothetical protein
MTRKPTPKRLERDALVAAWKIPEECFAWEVVETETVLERVVVAVAEYL